MRAAYPTVDMPGWVPLLAELEADQTGEDLRAPFKRWVLKRMGLPKRDRMPPRVFEVVLDHDTIGMPTARFRNAARQLPAVIDAQ